MHFTITINGEGEELANALRALKSTMDGHPVSTGSVTASVDTKTTPAPKSRSKAAEKPKEPETEVEPEQTVDPDPEPAVEAELDLYEGDNGPLITVEELRAKAGEVAKSGKQAEVKALLTKFEAASISALPEDKRSEFMKALEAL
jgi:hypothetical protein